MSFYRAITATAFALLLPVSAMAQTATDAANTTNTSKPAATAETTTTAPTKVPAPNSPVTHAELTEQIRQILINNPDILMEAAAKAHEKQMADLKKNANSAITRHHDTLLNDNSFPSIGPKNADVTLVEFFDYHCGYCHQLLPTVTKLTAQDKKVRIVFREFPILSQDSVTAARAALAVYRIAPEKYFNYHVALMKFQGKYDEETLINIAKGMGINGERLKTEMEKPEITVLLEKDRTLADDIGVRGTPALILGDTLFPGAVPYDDLKTLIAQVRSGKSPEMPGTGPSDTAVN